MLMTQLDTANYEKLFLNDIPMMDVRAPIEYEKGAFPNSQNIPILDNQQRQLIGTQFKQKGQDAAIALGLQLATPEIRQSRLQRWMQFIKAHPQGYLYCFRGGLRSRTTQDWLRQQGVHYPLVQGGYKAMRGYLLQQLDDSVQAIPFVTLTGLTGSGKTQLLQKTPYKVDLEGLAHHRGSAFGHGIEEIQPTQINWENQLSIACLKFRIMFPDYALLMEDEGSRIGRILLPAGFYQKLQCAPRLVLESELEKRITLIKQDYIDKQWPSYQRYYGYQAIEQFSQFVINNLARIKKRLGGARHQTINRSFKLALSHLFKTGNSDLFDEGISLLLREYYDPMYQYQFQQKQSKILFVGKEDEILGWIEQNLKNLKDD